MEYVVTKDGITPDNGLQLPVGVVQRERFRITS